MNAAIRTVVTFGILAAMFYVAIRLNQDEEVERESD